MKNNLVKGFAIVALIVCLMIGIPFIKNYGNRIIYDTKTFIISEDISIDDDGYLRLKYYDEEGYPVDCWIPEMRIYKNMVAFSIILIAGIGTIVSSSMILDKEDK